MKVTLTQEEIEIAKRAIGRELSESEALLLDAVWSEHCSYKSSKVLLRSFFMKSDRIVMGVEDWQDAGAIDIGDDYAIVLKVESHNHPSALDPFNGAATGVGGIIRDIISKGARPIALLDMIRIGENERSKWLLKNIVSGIGFYGNSIGVPVVSGEIAFDETYNDNPLVDVAAIGVVKKNTIIPSVVKVPGLKLVLVGETGIDGIGGASFASRKLSGQDERGAVQIADPFAGKIIIDATLEVAPYVVAIKDLGGGGLAVAVTEMANGLGAEVNLERVPLKVKGMLPEEIIVSETQERMLYAVKPENVEKVCKVFEYYEYPCSIIGEINDSGMITFKYNDKIVTSLPSNLLLSPPLILKDVMESKKIIPKERVEVPFDIALRRVLTYKDIVSKEWAYSQYDYEVGTSTVIKPGEADAGLISLPNGKLLGVKGDGNQDWCYYDTYECGKGLVAESYRNLATIGAKGIALVDHLQFGDPNKPEVYYEFLEAVRGIGEASRFFNTPIVGGKVSFYNENKSGVPIKPTPLIVMVGLVEGKFLRPHYDDGYIIQIGLTREEFAGSLFGKIFGDFGEVLRSRLNEDYLSSELMISGINEDKAMFITDINRGGLAVALFKMIVKGLDISIDVNKIPSVSSDPYALFFSESQGRFLVLTQEPDYWIRSAEHKGLYASIIGSATRGYGYSLKVNDKVYGLNKEVKDYYELLERWVTHD